MKERWLIILLMMICFSCRQSSQKSNDGIMLMADMECRAISLREQRFALANKIRFAQDTLLQVKSANDSARLNDSLCQYLQEKETLLQASLQLADTIHRQLDSLRKFSFKNVDDKQSFDNELKKELQKRGCGG